MPDPRAPTAGDMMRRPVHTIHAAESVSQAVRLMQLLSVSSLIVLPRYQGEPYGIITAHDIVVKVVAEGQNPMRVRVAEVMSRPLHTVSPDSSMQECAALMMRHHIRRLPVFDDGRLVGILSHSNVVEALLG